MCFVVKSVFNIAYLVEVDVLGEYYGIESAAGQ